MPVLIGAVALLGLAVGSFLNVVVYRIPAGLSLVSPGSHCPACDHPIRARHNVPVLGWLALRGRCADCSSPISARYPLVEAGTAILFVITALQLRHLDRLPSTPAYLYLAAAGVALALIDGRSRRLPNSIVYPSYPVLLVLLAGASAVSGDWSALLRAVIGGVSCFGLYFVFWLAYPAGMGFGDVKLAGLLGLALGYLSWSALIVGTFAAFVVGGIVGVVLLAATDRGRKSAIAFGPFMVVGVWVAFLASEPIAHAYLGLSRTA
jgi:leader peptidase (prepilin peptidase)/N-methyltransferase